MTFINVEDYYAETKTSSHRIVFELNKKKEKYCATLNVHKLVDPNFDYCFGRVGKYASETSIKSTDKESFDRLIQIMKMYGVEPIGKHPRRFKMFLEKLLEKID